MSARDEWLWDITFEQYEQMCAEIDRLREQLAAAEQEITDIMESEGLA